jgi:hypothetical protein
LKCFSKSIIYNILGFLKSRAAITTISPKMLILVRIRNASATDPLEPVVCFHGKVLKLFPGWAVVVVVGFQPRVVRERFSDGDPPPVTR